ncbi:FMN-binding negative transcriptional regulator [Agromyces sp. G08B096]|uniref:FMN-binding negative transcriptional regulator n=1 Tax=Agromyces sp. G08B096 TaxID=3156399 RepID=A0AAU7WAG5_9MICO
MRQNPSFTLASEDGVKRVIREHPWMTIVSDTDAAGLVASHYPVLLDEDADGIVLLTHVGRPDEVLHELGRHEVLVIVQGPHGYISPGWYDHDAPGVPTWNFVTAHLYGTPELLEPAENLRVLEQLVDHFERELPEPRRMRGTPLDSEYADRIAVGTVGLRIPVTRFTAKNKMSQNKPAETVDRIIAELEGDGPYASSALAAEMRRTHDALRSAQAAARAARE